MFFFLIFLLITFYHTTTHENDNNKTLFCVFHNVDNERADFICNRPGRADYICNRPGRANYKTERADYSLTALTGIRLQKKSLPLIWHACPSHLFCSRAQATKLVSYRILAFHLVENQPLLFFTLIQYSSLGNYESSKE